MDWIRAAATCLSALLPLVLSYWLFRKIAPTRALSAGGLLLTAAAGAVGAVAAMVLELRILAWTGISLRASEGGALGAALAMGLVIAPLEEALKIAAVWPSYLRRRLTSGRVGVLYAVTAASGFACLEMVLAYFVLGTRQWVDVLRLVIALPAHLFFASLWGFALARERRNALPLIWLGVALLHGGYDYVVFGRGAALLVVVIPVLLMMVFGTWMMLRDDTVEEVSRASAQSSSEGLSVSDGRRSLFEPPSVRSFRRAMRSSGQPLMLHWIAFGALVTLGVTLAFLAAAVYVGHRYGVDFALVDESDLDASLPLAVLGGALLAAFSVSGYLVARASGARSVIEPAWATGAAILMTLGMFSIAEPMALIVGASIAPVGFALGCVGAWFGIDRQ